MKPNLRKVKEAVTRLEAARQDPKPQGPRKRGSLYVTDRTPQRALRHFRRANEPT